MQSSSKPPALVQTGTKGGSEAALRTRCQQQIRSLQGTEAGGGGAAFGRNQGGRIPLNQADGAPRRPSQVSIPSFLSSPRPPPHAHRPPPPAAGERSGASETFNSVLMRLGGVPPPPRPRRGRTETGSFICPRPCLEWQPPPRKSIPSEGDLGALTLRFLGLDKDFEHPLPHGRRDWKNLRTRTPQSSANPTGEPKAGSSAREQQGGALARLPAQLPPLRVPPFQLRPLPLCHPAQEARPRCLPSVLASDIGLAGAGCLPRSPAPWAFSPQAA